MCVISVPRIRVGMSAGITFVILLSELPDMSHSSTLSYNAILCVRSCFIRVGMYAVYSSGPGRAESTVQSLFWEAIC